jgi:PAS domain S-box-containing protein
MATLAQPTLTGAPPLRVLLVGNQEEDFFLIRELLQRNRNSFNAELDHVNSLDEARAMLQNGAFGLVIFEYQTGDAAAVRLLSELSSTGISVPFVLLTENADESTIAEIVEAGAWNSVDRSNLNGANLARTIRCTLALHSMQLGRQSAEEQLRKLSRAVEQSADVVMITDRNGIIEYVNPAFETLSGYARDEAIGQTPRILKSWQQRPEDYQNLWTTILSGNVYRSILVNRKKTARFTILSRASLPYGTLPERLHTSSPTGAISPNKFTSRLNSCNRRKWMQSAALPVVWLTTSTIC